MTIQELKDRYSLSEHNTGGNCMALYGELNTAQDHILIADDNMRVPENDGDFFTVSVFLNNEHGEPAHTFETTNIDHLSDQLAAIYELWGN